MREKYSNGDYSKYFQKTQKYTWRVKKENYNFFNSNQPSPSDVKRQVLYFWTSIWMLRTPNAGRNSHFQCFLCKKAKKARNLKQNFAKNTFFKFAPERWSTVLFPKKSFFLQKMLKMTILTRVWGAQHPNAGRNIQHASANIVVDCLWEVGHCC